MSDHTLVMMAVIFGFLIGVATLAVVLTLLAAMICYTTKQYLAFRPRSELDVEPMKGQSGE